MSWSDSRSPHSSIPSGNPEGGSCLQQDGCSHCSEGTRSDSSSVPAHSGFLMRNALNLLWTSKLQGWAQGTDFSPSRLASEECFFLSLRVIKVHLMLLPVPWTLLWSTIDPLQRLSTTRTGRCCSWGPRSTEVCPPTRDTLPTKTLKDRGSDVSNVTDWHAATSNCSTFGTSLEYPSCFELYGETKCIVYMQTDLQIK